MEVLVLVWKVWTISGGFNVRLVSYMDFGWYRKSAADMLDVPDYGLLNDLVWSDPSDTALDWEDNERGVSFCYGKSVINSFLATHVS